MKKKILFVTPFFHSTGGVQKVLKQRFEFLKQHFDLFVYESNAEEVTQESVDLITLFSINYKKDSLFPMFNYLKIYRGLIKKWNPDLIIVIDNGWKGLLLPYFTKNIPVLYERHGAVHFENEKKWFYSLKKVFFNLMAVKFDKIYFLNVSMALNWKHQQKKVLSNGIQINSRYNINKIPQNVLWIGREASEKGLDRILKIWQDVSSLIPNWSLLLYTPTKIKDPIFYELQLKSKIVNVVGVTDLAKIYSSGSIVVNTSRYEGFGMTILEGMSYGLPVISFDCECGPKYLIDNEVTGCLISNDDLVLFGKKLLKLANDEYLRMSFGKAAYEKSKLFDIDKINRLWLKEYEEVLKE